MSEKALDNRGRWRNVTVAFRMSPEENTMLNNLVSLSGMTKQEYIIQRLLKKDVVVQGNPRVYKALRGQMERIHAELQRISDCNELDPDFVELVRFVAGVYDGMSKSK